MISQAEVREKSLQILKETYGIEASYMVPHEIKIEIREQWEKLGDDPERTQRIVDLLYSLLPHES